MLELIFICHNAIFINSIITLQTYATAKLMTVLPMIRNKGKLKIDNLFGDINQLIFTTATTTSTTTKNSEKYEIYFS